MTYRDYRTIRSSNIVLNKISTKYINPDTKEVKKTNQPNAENANAKDYKRQ